MDKDIEQSASRRLELAFPQLIAQDKLDMSYVKEWKLDAEKALRLGRNITRHVLADSPYDLFHWRKSSVSGIWFISINLQTVDYLYAYQSIRLEGIHRASGALAYLFTHGDGVGKLGVRGVTKGIFFDHLLPDQKFVVTDSIYTPDGRRWFEAEYATAFGRGYNVYAIDMKAKKGSKVRQITSEEFVQLQPLYWGLDTAHQKYRFAIELP